MLFDLKTDLATLHRNIYACRRCLEAGYDITPGTIFPGGPEARVMLIGQAPGVTEVTAHRPFNAGSGRRLFQWLAEAGWEESDFRSHNYMTAVTKCYPGRNRSGRGDRVPGKVEQALCRPFLDQEIRLINPVVMMLVGGLAIRLLYPQTARLDEIIGTGAYFPSEALADPLNFDLAQATTVTAEDWPLAEATPGGRLVVPLPHPSGASLWPNRPENKVLISRAMQLLAAARASYGV